MLTWLACVVDSCEGGIHGMYKEQRHRRKLAVPIAVVILRCCVQVPGGPDQHDALCDVEPAHKVEHRDDGHAAPGAGIPDQQ